MFSPEYVSRIVEAQENSADVRQWATAAVGDESKSGILPLPVNLLSFYSTTGQSYENCLTQCLMKMCSSFIQQHIW
jgi:hypothetical protein